METSENPFGVLDFIYWNHSWNNYQYPDKQSIDLGVALMRKAGVGWVRMDFLWQDIEPRQGERHFEKYDYIVNALTAGGIGILGVLSYHTDWASPQRAWNVSSDDTSMFTAYCSAVAARYKDRVKYWEIWNEPDSGTYWQPQDGMKRYCILLKDAYRALKKVDPECFVLNGGLANGLTSVNRLYDNGAKDYFDIFNIHDFQSPYDKIAIKRTIAYVNTAYKVMCRNGDGRKKIWLTEIGCPGVKRGIQTEPWWMGRNPSEKQQAQWVRQVCTELPKVKPLDKFFWAFFRDTDRHWETGVDYFGLVRHDFKVKPAFEEYRKAVKAYQKGAYGQRSAR